jgi:hypothetical protein
MADEHTRAPADPMTDGDAASPFLGPNAWLVEEMYEQYRSDPTSVSENWRDFFEDYRSSRPQPAAAPAPPVPAAASVPPPPPAAGTTPAPAPAAPSRRHLHRPSQLLRPPRLPLPRASRSAGPTR